MRTRDLVKLFRTTNGNQTEFLRCLLLNGQTIDKRVVEVAKITNLRARICEIKRNYRFKDVRNVAPGMYIL